MASPANHSDAGTHIRLLSVVQEEVLLMLRGGPRTGVALAGLMRRKNGNNQGSVLRALRRLSATGLAVSEESKDLFAHEGQIFKLTAKGRPFAEFVAARRMLEKKADITARMLRSMSRSFYTGMLSPHHCC